MTVSLSQEEIPTRWYNIQADLAEPLPPPLDPGTKQPVNPASLERIFAKELIRQEDRKSTRLNSSHLVISYAVFCLKKKKIIKTTRLLLECCICFIMTHA